MGKTINLPGYENVDAHYLAGLLNRIHDNIQALVFIKAAGMLRHASDLSPTQEARYKGLADEYIRDFAIDNLGDTMLQIRKLRTGFTEDVRLENAKAYALRYVSTDETNS